VLAAGTGSRVGAARPKQLLTLLGKPVVAHALDQHTRLGHHVIAVASKETEDEIGAYVDEHLAARSVEIVRGGATRRESVLAGIEAIPQVTARDTGVFLRNAASPNTPDCLLQSCLDGVHDHDGIQAFVRSNETTFIRAHQNLDWVIARDVTGFTADPTAYRRELLERIADQLRGDDSGETTIDIARRLGANIGLAESPRTNIKLTTADDLLRLELAMKAAVDEG
jgi:2-C-methyl-D-erythritol 4-phosphate cytidylyltransferase